MIDDSPPVLLYVSALVLTLAIPFERLEPALTLPGQKLTNLEIVMLIAIGCWVLTVVRTRDTPEITSSLSRPVGALLAAMIVSTLLAGEHQINAVKFTGRFVAGFMVFLLAIRTLSSPGRAMRLTAAMLAAAVVVSGIALCEWLEVGSVIDWLTQFRPGVAVVGGHVRATSTLQYPTITSMYLEVAFALGLALYASAVDRRQWGLAIVTGVALWLVGVGVVLTFTRAGLIVLTAVLTTALVVWVVRRRFDRGVIALATLEAAIMVVIAFSFTGGLQWLRITTEGQQGWYRATYVVPDRLSLQTREIRLVDVRVRNDGRVTWVNDERTPFRLSYHWLDRTGRPVEFDGVRTPFDEDVPPGREVALRARVKAPARPGVYQLAWDLVQEQRLWFSTEGAPGPRTTATVEGEPSATVVPPSLTELPRPRPRLGRVELWRAAASMVWMRPLFGVGPDNFRLQYGRFVGTDRADTRVHANNLYLEFLTGVGLVGGTLAFWLVWRLVRAVAHRFRDATTEQLPLAVGAGAAVIAILLHGVVDAFFEFTPTYLTIWLAFALLMCDERWETKVPKVPEVPEVPDVRSRASQLRTLATPGTLGTLGTLVSHAHRV